MSFISNGIKENGLKSSLFYCNDYGCNFKDEDLDQHLLKTNQ